MKGGGRAFGIFPRESAARRVDRTQRWKDKDASDGHTPATIVHFNAMLRPSSVSSQLPTGQGGQVLRNPTVMNERTLRATGYYSPSFLFLEAIAAARRRGLFQGRQLDASPQKHMRLWCLFREPLRCPGLTDISHRNNMDELLNYAPSSS